MSVMRISDLAGRAHVPISTVRYYERIGLLPAPGRLANGYRVYEVEALEHLAFIARAKRIGVPLDEVAELSELWSSGGCEAMKAKLTAFVSGRVCEVRDQRLDLAAFEHQLEVLAARLVREAPVAGPCDLNCACVRLDPADEGPACSRFPRASREAPTGCALRRGEVAGRLSDWAVTLAQGRLVERTGSRLRVSLASSADTVARVAGLCAAEVTCCPFVSFGLDIRADGVVLLVDGGDSPDGRALVARLALDVGGTLG